MRTLLRYLNSYKKEAVLAPLFKMLEASFELFVPLVVAAIIDRGIGQGSRSYVLRMGLLMLALALVGLVCSVTAQYFSAKAATGFASDVRTALFAHLQSLSWSDIDKLGTSAMITRMTSDLNQVQTGINLTLRLLLRSPFVVFGAMVMAFTVNAPAAVTFVVVIPLLCVVVFGIMLVNIPMYRKVQGALDSVLAKTRENLAGVRVVRAFGREKAQTEDYRGATDLLCRIQLMAGRVSALMNPVTYLIINTGIIVLISRGALQVDSGSITQGELTALVNYMSQILVELIKMANLIISITKAVACGNRIQDVFERRPGMTYGSDDARETAQGAAGDEVLLELSHAGIRYHETGDEALQDVSLRIRPGEVTGIIGGTGSGKSTLVNLMARFYDVSEGEVLLHGKPISTYSSAALRRIIHIVPQKAVLFHGTVAENLRWGKEDASEAEMTDALRIAQAEEFVMKKEGLQTMIEQEGRNLSGGQRQRLTVARAVIGNPKLLILDDSSSALDYATDAAMRSAIRHMSGRPALVIVSQRTSSLRGADQIVVLDDGLVAGIGKHEDLLRTCTVYREIHQSQYPDEQLPPLQAETARVGADGKAGEAYA